MRNHFIAVSLVALALSGCGTTKMDQIALGMSKDEVTAAIGAPRNVVEASAFGGTKTEVWEYKAKGPGNFNVQFTDEKVEGWRRAY